MLAFADDVDTPFSMADWALRHWYIFTFRRYFDWVSSIISCALRRHASLLTSYYISFSLLILFHFITPIFSIISIFFYFPLSLSPFLLLSEHFSFLLHISLLLLHYSWIFLFIFFFHAFCHRVSFHAFHHFRTPRFQVFLSRCIRIHWHISVLLSFSHSYICRMLRPRCLMFDYSFLLIFTFSSPFSYCIVFPASS